MVNIKKFYSLLLFVVLINSCNKRNKQEKWQHIQISPLNGSQVITVITKEKKRYIMNGKHRNIPINDYILLDLSKVDPLGDGFSICWDKDGLGWKIASAYAKLVKNNLDTSHYKFNQSLGDYGQPTSDGYEGDNCGGILIRENRKPRGNLRVKYIDIKN